VRTALRLLKPDRIPIYHFFFAPNRRTSRIAATVLALKRRRTVHTLCSVPRSFEGLGALLFADRIVALSRHTLERLLQAGVRGAVHIPPCVPSSPPVPQERKQRTTAALGLPQRQLVLFPGDYEFSSAASVCAGALPSILQNRDAHFVFACRVKTAAAVAAEAAIRTRVADLGLCDRVTFTNEVEDMEALVASAALTVLPADSLYAKMDIPLVLLESLREGVPVVVSDHGPLPELAEGGGAAVVPTGSSEALAEAVLDLLGSPEQRARMGRDGREFVAARHSPAGMALRHESLYDSLV
jgi:phosphatidylinositol alpha-1,6-mannosyltransferase